MRNLSMEATEQLFRNAEKIDFLLETAIMYHLDLASPELEIIINLLKDTNTFNKNKLEEIVFND